MFPRCLVIPAVLGALLIAACEGPVHPSDPGIPAALCQPRCQRQHDCDATVDVASCVARCERFLSPRVVYDREDLVALDRACAEQQACVPDVDKAIGACMNDAFRRLEPTPRAQAFCKAAIEKDHACGEPSSDYEHCIYGKKAYSDPILTQMTACLDDHPCKSYGLCLLAIVGEDIAIQDRDRQAAFRRKPVPQAGPDSVAVRGRVITEANVGIAGASVCLRGKAETPCVTTDESGAFTLTAPAHEEFAVTAAAAGYGSRVVALETVGRDVESWSVTLATDASLRARYAAAGASYPDPATGFVFATARAPAGSKSGFDGATLSLAPAAAKAPIFFTPDGSPDPKLTATSTWSSGLLVNLAPGEAEITFGPESVTCVPSYGGWPSKRPNSVRIPIVAGFETRVTMQCHR